MKSPISTDELTQSKKQITKPMRLTLRRVAIAVAVVLSGSGLIVINNTFNSSFNIFNFYIFGWGQPDDGEIRSDGREVRISWGADLSLDSDPDIRRECSGFVFCQAFNYELIGFGPGSHTYECLINDQRWPSYPVRGREGCRARGNNLIVAHVVVDGVKSDPLRWTRPG